MTTQRTLRIDDEMVERGCKESLGDGWVFNLCTKESMRRVLEAALSPYLERRKADRRVCKDAPGISCCAPSKPSKDQTRVSEGMTQACLWAFYKVISGEIWRPRERHQEMAMAYRAMRLKEIEELQNPDLGVR